MRKNKYRIPIVALILLSVAVAFSKKQTEPWRPDQLMEPKELADIINDSSSVKPLIINIGPAGVIKDAVDIGATHEPQNLDRLKTTLSPEKRDRQIVIYCGCCPFQNCPNIRPAFTLLNEMKFTNHKLLNLPHNLKVDWINYGYPMTHKQ
jgi:hypothetical protein